MTTYYVDKDTGDDGDDGLSKANAWATLSHAVTTVSSNTASSDTVRVIAGATAYDEALDSEFSGDHSSNPHTIISDDSAAPAVITPTAAQGALWKLDNTDGWVFDDLTFRDTTGYPSGGKGRLFRLGQTTQVTNITFQNCRFWHSTRSEQIILDDCDTVTINTCHFRDCRSRVAAEDAGGIGINANGTADNVTITGCVFEDMGSDGFAADTGASASNLLIEYSVFGVNRPYSSSGTSFYNGDTTTWQDFSTNVGEGGIDIKSVPAANVTIQYCGFWGFRKIISGQDTNGNHAPAVIPGLVSGGGANVLDCYFYDNHVHVKPGNGATAVIRRCLFHKNGGSSSPIAVFHSTDAGGGADLTMEDCIFVGMTDTAIYMKDINFTGVKYNIFDSGTYTKASGLTGNTNWNWNTWGTGVSTPSGWDGPDDYAEADEVPVDVEEVDTLGGNLEFRHHLNRQTIVIPSEVTQYHPDGSALGDGVELAFLASSTVTVTKESSSPLRFSIKVEQ